MTMKKVSKDCRFVLLGNSVIWLLMALVLVLVWTAVPVQAQGSKIVSRPVSHLLEQNSDTLVVCVALIGGALLLAGGVWITSVRRISS